MFAFEHADVVADAVALGKPLGGGLPLSAVVGRAELLDVPTYSLFTLGGSPLPCAAGLATLDVIDEEGLVDNAARTGKRLLDGLVEIQRRSTLIGDVRGRGLILGVELVADRATTEPAPRDAHRLGVPALRARCCSSTVRSCGQRHRADAAADDLRGGGRRGARLFERALADVEAGRFDDAKLAPFAGW